MERGFVVGHVGSSEQAEAVLRAAQGVPSPRSVEGYLPVKDTSPQSSAVSNTASDVTITAEIKSALTLAGVVVRRVSVETLDGRTVLLGVASSERERLQAERAAAGVKGCMASRTGCSCRSLGIRQCGPNSGRLAGCSDSVYHSKFLFFFSFVSSVRKFNLLLDRGRRDRRQFGGGSRRGTITPVAVTAQLSFCALIFFDIYVFDKSTPQRPADLPLTASGLDNRTRHG